MSALIVLAGQSNALGFHVTPGELPADYRPDPHVQIWAGDHFEIMVAGLNTGTAANPNAWGPEVGFARAWTAEHLGETLYLVKVAKGSTGIADDPTQLDWSAESHELFAQATATIAAAKVAAWLPVSAVLWMQGEQDAIDPGKADAYAANLRDLFAHMRTDWAWYDTPIIVGRIGAEAHEAFAETVRAAQGEVVATDGHAALVDTDGFELQADHLHLDGAGQIQLGEAFDAALDVFTPPRPFIDWAAFLHLEFLRFA